MLSFFPRDVLDGILNLIESVSEGFPTFCYKSEYNGQLKLTKGRNSMRNLSGGIVLCTLSDDSLYMYQNL